LAKKQKKSPTLSHNTASESPMDASLLERLVRLMAANDLNTVEVRDGDKRVVLKRTTPQAAGYVMPAPVMQAGPVLAPSAASAAAPGVSSEEAGFLQIKSPMVGTFYSSSGPDATAFVFVGSQVDEDTDVCIIEAMKVFNNIKAECKGTVARILVNNGETVEFGQVLFLVKPT
jgi:acetyl-CoA carboxylase biotin carboxyl carrier protein